MDGESVNGKKKGGLVGRVVSTLLGLACTAVLGFLFYGTMVYQLTGENAAQSAAALPSPAPLMPGQSAQALFPGELLALQGMQMTGEQARDVEYGGTVCRVITRTYLREDGAQVKAVSAYPDAYVQRFAQEGWTPQLVAGFAVGELDAVYALRGGDAALYARRDGCVYVIEAPAGEQALYALGAAAQIGGL